MKQRKGLLRRMVEQAKASSQLLQGISLVELAGDRRVLVEHHFGVTEYEQTQIGVQMKFGKLYISGKDLMLAEMTREQLVITGRIDALLIERREC